MRRVFGFIAVGVMLPIGVAAAEITMIEDLRRNTTVTVEGIVDRITDEDEFVLSDATGNVEVYIGPNAMPVQPNDKVRVTGVVDDGLLIEIYAREIVLPDGQVVALSHGYD